MYIGQIVQILVFWYLIVAVVMVMGNRRLWLMIRASPVGIGSRAPLVRYGARLTLKTLPS